MTAALHVISMKAKMAMQNTSKKVTGVVMKPEYYHKIQEIKSLQEVICKLHKPYE